MGVSHQTFYRWLGEHGELSDTLKKGREIVNDRVEDALYRKATGQTEATEEHVHIRTEGEGENARTVKDVKKVKKLTAPDTISMIFWLKNKRAEDWRDRKEVVFSGDIEDANKQLESVFDQKPIGPQEEKPQEPPPEPPADVQS